MFCREYDRLEAEGRKHQCKPKYALAAPEHEALAKSTAELMCHPQLKGRVATAIKEVLTTGPTLEELVIGMVRSSLYRQETAHNSQSPQENMLEL